jgi:hypothetical protein
VDGEIHLTVYLPLGPNPSQALKFPEPIHATEDGPIVVPKDELPDIDDGSENGMYDPYYAAEYVEDEK